MPAKIFILSHCDTCMSLATAAKSFRAERGIFKTPETNQTNGSTLSFSGLYFFIETTNFFNDKKYFEIQNKNYLQS